MYKSSSGDHNFYPHKSNVIINYIKDKSKRFKTISNSTKVKCIPDSCDDVCSQSSDRETVSDTSNQVAAVDESRRDWLEWT